MEPRMGRNRVVVAVLLEHSVNVATSRESSIAIANGGMLCRGVRLCPSHSDSFDTWIETLFRDCSSRSNVK